MKKIDEELLAPSQIIKALQRKMREKVCKNNYAVIGEEYDDICIVTAPITGILTEDADEKD